jgi:hypothetical protein
VFLQIRLESLLICKAMPRLKTCDRLGVGGLLLCRQGVAGLLLCRQGVADLLLIPILVGVADLLHGVGVADLLQGVGVADTRHPGVAKAGGVADLPGRLCQGQGVEVARTIHWKGRQPVWNS